MVTLRVDSAKVSGALRELGEKLGPGGLAEPLGQIGRALLARVQGGFRAGVDPYGEGWQPLKRRKGKPLLDSGRLRSSLTASVSDTAVTLGTNVVYAPVHQFGHTFRRAARSQQAAWDKRGRFAKGKKIVLGSWVTRGAHDQVVPARPFLPTAERGVPARWMAKILEVLRAHLRGETAPANE